LRARPAACSKVSPSWPNRAGRTAALKRRIKNRILFTSNLHTKTQGRKGGYERFSGKKIGRMKNIFYELIMMDFFVGKRQVRSGRQIAEKRFGFERLGIVIEGMKRAAELVEVFVTEIIMTDDGRAEESEQKKKEQRPDRLLACRLGRVHVNCLFFNELMKKILYCPGPDLSI
jgi:hypothetical protein